MTLARRDTRGAVYVEFLIAFLPVLVFFLCVLQLAMLYTAKLYVDHAAVIAARSAAVVFGDDPQHYGNARLNQMNQQRRDVVRRAAVMALGPLILDGTLQALDVQYPPVNDATANDNSNTSTNVAPMQDQQVTMMRVRIEAAAKCKIAFANRIACPGGFFGLPERADLIGAGQTRVMRSTAVYPYMGARYQYERR